MKCRNNGVFSARVGFTGPDRDNLVKYLAERVLNGRGGRKAYNMLHMVRPPDVDFFLSLVYRILTSTHGEIGILQHPGTVTTRKTKMISTDASESILRSTLLPFEMDMEHILRTGKHPLSLHALLSPPFAWMPPMRMKETLRTAVVSVPSVPILHAFHLDQFV